MIIHNGSAIIILIVSCLSYYYLSQDRLDYVILTANIVKSGARVQFIVDDTHWLVVEPS